MSTWTNLYFQNSNSPLMEQILFFHDHLMLILIIIILMILYLMIFMIMNKYTNQFFKFNQKIEIIWTIIPMSILSMIIFPSLRLLYLLDEMNFPSITLKIIGNQWFWKYEYSNFLISEFNSFLKLTFKKSNFRMIDTDMHIILPMKLQIQIMVTASDVIHSWTIPSLGIKIDATPGHLNQMIFFMNSPGLFFGQCSEICGINHSFMPILIESTSLNLFMKWINMLKN